MALHAKSDDGFRAGVSSNICTLLIVKTFSLGNLFKATLFIAFVVCFSIPAKATHHVRLKTESIRTSVKLQPTDLTSVIAARASMERRLISSLGHEISAGTCFAEGATLERHNPVVYVNDVAKLVKTFYIA